MVKLPTVIPHKLFVAILSLSYNLIAFCLSKQEIATTPKETRSATNPNVTISLLTKNKVVITEIPRKNKSTGNSNRKYTKVSLVASFPKKYFRKYAINRDITGMIITLYCIIICISCPCSAKFKLVIESLNTLFIESFVLFILFSSS